MVAARPTREAAAIGIGSRTSSRKTKKTKRKSSSGYWTAGQIEQRIRRSIPARLASGCSRAGRPDLGDDRGLTAALDPLSCPHPPRGEHLRSAAQTCALPPSDSPLIPATAGPP